MKNLTISSTFSDAFDSDFSTGVIDSCSFFDVDGDAVDLSGSEVNIKNSKFKNVRDKVFEFFLKVKNKFKNEKTDKSK